MFLTNNKNKGFTLLELLVVISIIGFLSSVVMASLNSARDKAKIAAGMEYSGYLERTMGKAIDFKFDDTNKLLTNSSGNKQANTEGAVSANSDTYNKKGYSLSFSPGAAIIWPSKTDSDFDFENKNFAISIWLKTDGSNLSSNSYNSARIIWTGHCNTGRKGYTIAISTAGNPGGRIETGIIGEGGVGFYFHSTENLNILDNKWHNIAVVFSFTNKTASIFFDGRKINGIVNDNIGGTCSTIIGGSLDFSQCNLNYISQNDATDLYIGKSPDGLCGVQTYSGLLDDVTILREI
jgi:prepilin-type N-terminal cleavage/methylation domain-containing protein